MLVYNTLTRKKEKFIPINNDNIGFYYCGPTVYWAQHIGNLRGMTMADLIRRSLMYLGYNVNFVRNYTDVGHLTSDGDEGEDKMEKGAKRESKTPQEVAEKYIKLYEHDTEAINILNPTYKPRATEYIRQMIESIQILLEKGVAYNTSQAIYFDVLKFPNYTQLSGQNLERMKVNAGKGNVEDKNKRNPLDFALWFYRTGAHKNAIQYWKSPFGSPEVEDGVGFPGWHLECSVMARDLIGDTLDFHMGGVEHISIHHTNEIAQSESITGKRFCNYWLHNEHLTVDNKKMSKSLGNVYLLQEILGRGFDPMDLRYFYLQSHYKSKQNFTWEALQSARNARMNLVGELDKIFRRIDSSVEQKYNRKWDQEFASKIEDNFNIPEALAVVWNLLKSGASDEEKYSSIERYDRVLGLNLFTHFEISKEANALIKEREEAKKNKDYKKADAIRLKLNAMGLIIEDSKNGSICYMKK